ncbi:MAG: adenylosuccinate synthetase, partial [Ghiorsea sp.]
DNTFGLTDISKLPAAATALLKRIEDVCQCPITMLSTGPDRDHICHF